MIDVVTLSWKRPDECERCIAAILVNSGDNIANIYIVINEYTDEYKRIDLIDDDRIHIIPLKTNEGVIARNHALKLCTSKYIAQIDDDVIVRPAWDDKALQMLEDDVTGVGEDGHWVIPDFSNFSIEQQPNHGDYCDVLTGFCWIFKNNNFLYDESFGMHWHEETDLQFQMREAGYRFKKCSGMCDHYHAGKPNHWNEYHDINIKRVQDKWLYKKEQLHLEVPC